MMAFMEARTKPNGFAGLRVLSLESRRAAVMAKLIEAYGGTATVAPSMREIPLESNKEAQAFTRELLAGGFDVVILLTGVGTRALARVAETVCTREEFVAALRRVPLVARGARREARLSPATRQTRRRAGVRRPEPGASGGPCRARRTSHASPGLRVGAG